MWVLHFGQDGAAYLFSWLLCFLSWPQLPLLESGSGPLHLVCEALLRAQGFVLLRASCLNQDLQ